MVSRLRIGIFEFFSGGGCPPGELPQGLAAEALGMLWALVSDFHRWGAARTITALDSRFEEYIPGLNRATLPADEIIPAQPGGYMEVYVALLQRCDAVLVVAPETDDMLAVLVMLAENAGIPHLGSNSAAARIAGNKAECARIFLDNNVPAPKTCIADVRTAYQKAGELGFPLIIKPVDGVGCEGVCRADSLEELPACLQRTCQVTSHETIILQSFVPGIAASVSLLAADGEFRLLSLNRQLVHASCALHYSGSQVPYDHAMKTQAWETVLAAARMISGLRGYVGADLVLTHEGCQILEINPRLTTSYLGLRQVTSCNLARAIWNACRHNSLPEAIPLSGHVVIRKDEPGTWGMMQGDMLAG